jgi:hypothetical protein
VLETVVEGVTGCFWAGEPSDLAAAVLEFDDTAIDPQACVRQAARFDSTSFRRGLRAEVELARAGISDGVATRRAPARSRTRADLPSK